MKPLRWAMFAVAAIWSAATPALAQTDAALAALFTEERAVSWREDPLSATYDGVHDYDDRLPSVAPADFARRVASDEAFLARLSAIDRGALSHQDQISYDLFGFILTQRVTLARHRDWRAPLNSDSGFYADILLLSEAHDFRTVRDYENYIARLNAIPAYFEQNIDNMRLGLREGFTLPQEILAGVSDIVSGAQIADVEASTFWAPFARFPETIPAADQARLAAAGRAAIQNSVAPAYAAFKRFFDSEYRPRARRSIGAGAMPGGRAYYADLVRYYTTLPNATQRQVHQTVFAEVALIRAEI